MPGVQKKESSVSPERMLEFAAFLRNSPDAMNNSAQDLSKRFGLPQDIVQESLSVARVTRQQADARADVGGGELWLRIGGWFSGLPHLFGQQILPISLLAGLLIGYALWIAQRHGTPSTLLTASIVIVIALSSLALAALSRARIRYAVAGAVIAAAAITILRFVLTPPPAGAEQGERLIALVAQVSVFSVIGAAFMVASSIVGGLYRIRQEEKAESQLDRLQLLQRIFRLQERLEGREPAKQRPVLIVDWLRSVSNHWVLTSCAVGVSLSLVEVAATSLVGTVRPTGPQGWQSLFVFLVLSAITLLSYGLCGFLAGSWLRGAVSGFIVQGIWVGITLLPMKGWGVAAFVQRYENDSVEFWGTSAFAVLLALFGGIGATVDRRLQHRRRIHDADQAAILSEIVRYQQLLATGATEVCVVAIDCVGSTKMKRGADALAVEISFRLLHEFIERVVLRHGGVVKSQVGDMAIAEFQCVSEGYAAGRTVQAQLSEFNRASNKLALPFRVRIGIHFGRILGTIEEVQFSRVIDVAAHLEKVAPAGGIALSDDAAAALETEQFIELANEVDGHKVFLSTDPTS